MDTTPPPFEPPEGAPPPAGPPGGPPPSQPPTRATLPWETPGFPALEGLYETAKLVITNPIEAFSRIPLVLDLGKPLLYAVIFGWIGIIASQVYNIALGGAMEGLATGLGAREQVFFSTGYSVAAMILAPVLVLVFIFIWSIVLHLFLMLVGLASNGLTATIRTVCYVSTVQITQVLPFCGGIIGGIWALVLYIVGLAQAHRPPDAAPDYGRATLAVLLPLVLCCACAAFIAIVSGLSIAGLISSYGR